MTNIHTKIKQKAHAHIHHRLTKHLAKHQHKHIHRVLHHAQHAHHGLSHVGELIMVSFLGFLSLMFAGSIGLPANNYFAYPLYQVSTIECRTLHWNEMPTTCKIDMPVIAHANYEKYQDSKVHRDIYTVLRGATYQGQRDQGTGAHAGVDIATAEGTPLYSIGDGEIYSAGRQAGYGYVVKVKYLFQGKYIYAIYAHMEAIEVEKGDLVKKGERIGTVGNSGNTFGALGGYHVHFEINKDNHGRPMYAYLNCPDVSKGHSVIIKNGLCREQMQAHQYDPIAFLETYKLPGSVYGKTHNAPSETPNNTEKENYSETSSGSQDSAAITGRENDGTDQSTDQGTVIDAGGSIPDDLAPQDIEIQLDKLEKNAQHFASQRDIKLTTDTHIKGLFRGNDDILTLSITKKNSDQGFNGVLPIPFTIVTSNTNVSVDYTSIQLIRNGEIDITLAGIKKGQSTIIVNLGFTPIAKIPVEVK